MNWTAAGTRGVSLLRAQLPWVLLSLGMTYWFLMDPSRSRILPWYEPPYSRQGIVDQSSSPVLEVWKLGLYALLLWATLNILQAPKWLPRVLGLQVEVVGAVEVAHAGHVQVIQSLRERAVRLRATSRLVLVLILGTIVVGITIFVNADRIAATEADRYETQLRRVNLALRAAVLGGSFDTIGVSEAIERTEATLDELSGRVEALARGDANTALVSAMATRVGSVLLLLFLVQILVTLYRYNTRLAAFYESRADALHLASLRGGGRLQDLVAALSPDGVDYGKMPATPTQQAIDLAKAFSPTRRGGA